jgi:hypothetical protein
MPGPGRYVRFAPESGHQGWPAERPLSAICGLMQRGKGPAIQLPRPRELAALEEL